MSWTTVVTSAALMLAIGAGAMYGGMRWKYAALPTAIDPAPAVPPGPPRSAAGGASPMVDAVGVIPDVVVPLAKDAAARAGITLATVVAGAGAAGLRAPGIVEPDGYGVVAVSPLVAGRVIAVNAELGQRVERGTVLATIFSPELAEWETRHVALRSELDAHERELARTERLVQIGSASRQELERLHAEHSARRAALQGSASRLRLFGLSTTAIEALDGSAEPNPTITVTASSTGIVTERLINPGSSVEPTTKLFTVVDLSKVWVVAEVYEQDFARVRVGATASITTPAYPGVTIAGRVSYIDPQVTTASRTAKVRIEVSNVRGDLRLGMLAEVVIGMDRTDALMIPQSAVQHAGDRTVVYLVDAQRDGHFIEREVELGAPAGEHVSVISGVHVGDVVVAQGSFSVRAERERLGLRGTIPPKRQAVSAQAVTEARQTVKIAVSENGYEPSTVTLRAGIPARIVMTRTTDNTCGTEIVFPSLNVTRALPLNKAVAIEFTPKEPGELMFVCGLGMLKGTIVVR